MDQTKRKRILFVDDEQALLTLYQGIFRAMQEVWEMDFATGGNEALRLMQSRPYDVIVSDMKMPEMNGSELLNQVMRRFPKTARIIISGYADQVLIAQCVGAAHQYLRKPEGIFVLRDIIKRVADLDQLLGSQLLQGVVEQVNAFPSKPDLYFRILDELQSPIASTHTIGEIIRQDPGMTAKLLQLVNSAFFGTARKVSDPGMAVQILGIETVRTLALMIHVFACFDQARCRNLSIEELWNHSFQTGMAAKSIAKYEGADQLVMDAAFTGGLLHDAGKLIMAANIPAPYGETKELARERAIPEWRAEMEKFGATHAEVGAYLLNLWGLPVSIVEAVTYHHTPRLCADKSFSALTAVHAADVLIHETKTKLPGPAPGEFDMDYLKALGLDKRIPEWRSRCLDLG